MKALRYFIISRHVPNTSPTQDEGHIISAFDYVDASAYVAGLQKCADRDCPDGFDPVEWDCYSAGFNTRAEAERELNGRFATV